ncbi:hypothetical protein P8C59_005647 [Phyllachora maydis]|uniref:Co-chaperone HscB C-terminal oligomerisation domain-containing protein n=1 Tax=Phyllachora maydis TaxID=1825666 RepID=A0AAD9MFQ1_9PEZI|nr:hypothetical protein P8C59_005647 [Phyllachora maydis]
MLGATAWSRSPAYTAALTTTLPRHSPAAAQPPPPPPPPFYALFPQTLPAGAPPAAPFAIDARALRREFLRLQAAAHPDVHGGGNGASAAINAAYRTLASPLLRAQYLLREQHGVDLAGDEAGVAAAAEPDVLAAVLDARERIEAAEEEAELDGVRAENEGRIAAAEAALAEAFGVGDVERATREAVRLRYWVNIRESVEQWERGQPVVLQH